MAVNHPRLLICQSQHGHQSVTSRRKPEPQSPLPASSEAAAPATLTGSRVCAEAPAGLLREGRGPGSVLPLGFSLRRRGEVGFSRMADTPTCSTGAEYSQGKGAGGLPATPGTLAVPLCAVGGRVAAPRSRSCGSRRPPGGLGVAAQHACPRLCWPSSSSGDCGLTLRARLPPPGA